MKKIKAFIFFMMIGATTFAQSPEKMNYQAVVRDASGASVTGALVGVKVSILSGNSTGPVVYSETHGVTTNNYGLITLQIGAGSVSGPAMSTIDWGIDDYYVKIEIDPTGGTAYSITSVSQLISVPYALYAKNVENVDDADADPANEYNTGAAMNGLDLEITDGGGTFSVDLSGLTTDPDMDPNNEIQTMSKLGQVVTLSNGGGAFTDDVNDADADPSNELNTNLTLIGTTLQLTDAGGTLSQDLSSLITGGDTSPTNELNTTVVLNGTNLEVSDAGGTIITDLSSLVNDADASATNEIQSITKVGSLVTLSDGGGSFTDDVNDADADPSNELQTISKAGNAITLSDGGGTVTVDDADADATNEYNTNATLTGTNLNITDGGGTIVVDMSSLVGGGDPSSTNELNTSANLTGTTLNIIDPGSTVSVDLSSLQDGVNDADADPTNEYVQSANLTGTNLNIIDGGGTTTVDLSTLGGASFYPGMHYQGGIIVYVDTTGQHGLIVGLTDIATADLFDAGGLNAVYVGTSMTDGAANTAALMALHATNNYQAANTCDSYSYAGFSDWYLPSAYELEIVAASNYILGTNALELGQYYWSSSEYDLAGGAQAWAVRSNPANMQPQTESSNNFRVRPMRAF